MFCSNCGTKLNDNDVFCNNCGAKVADAPVQQSDAVQIPEPAPAPPSPAPVPVPKAPRKPFGKKVIMDSKEFAFAVLAAVLLLVSSFLVHSPLISVERSIYEADYSIEFTISSADTKLGSYEMTEYTRVYDGTVSAGAVMGTITTILAFFGVVYMLLPFFIGKFMKQNFISYFVNALLAFCNLLIVLISVIGLSGDLEKKAYDINVGMSLDAWLAILFAVAALGILIWQGVMMIIKKEQ